MDKRKKWRNAACVLFFVFFFSCLTINHIYFFDPLSPFSLSPTSSPSSPTAALFNQLYVDPVKEEASTLSSSTPSQRQGDRIRMSTASQSLSLPLPRSQEKPRRYPHLLSSSKKVTSDTRGNLGPPEVVTRDDVKDWLKDRWQAASDMKGTPLKGKHWLQIDLERPCTLTSTLIDFETAYSQDWVIQGKVDPSANDWFDLVSSRSPTFQQYKTKLQNYEHIIQSVNITHDSNGEAEYYNNSNEGNNAYNNQNKRIRFVRLLINSPSTRWGTSVWRWKLFGFESI